MSGTITIPKEQLECLRRHLDQANQILIALGLPGVNKPPARSSKKKDRETYIKSIISAPGKAKRPPKV